MNPLIQVGTRLALAAALATFAVGCGNSPGNAPPATTAGAQVAEHDAELHAMPGFAHVEALPSLRAEQREALTRIKADLKTAMAPAHDARKAYAALIADSVASGTFDQARIETAIVTMSAAADATKPALQSAMNEVHKTLDPAQRAELVAAMRDRKHHKGGGDDMMHGGGEGHPKHRMKKLAQELGLSDDQKKAIGAEMKEEWKRARHEKKDMKERHEGMRDHMRAVGEAFQTDTFDARTLDVGKHAGVMARSFATRAAHMAEAASRVLTPAQRSELADRIRTRGAIL